MSVKLRCAYFRSSWVVMIAVLACSAVVACQRESANAEEPPPSDEFPAFIKRQAAELRANDAAPDSLSVWQQQRLQLRESLERAWGGFPDEHAEFETRVLGTLQRDGYRVEKLMFQTFPGVWMTANAYVPQLAGPRPAVLCVHGHWKGAKQDPHVQARCVGLAKLGFFVLAVDAMGAGERAVGKALGEYHGEMVAATLWPIGRPLSGLQVYENRRAVDYLLTRPEVDAERLGITGASGGGNQTMYAGAFDERFKAVVPVCSVGNYQAYLGAACCMCEVVPGALQFTEEWGVLSLTAPRALMVISATKDAFQFSVNEAKKSLALVKPVYELYHHSSSIRHTIFESPHDYNREMREAMYGWMTLHLKGEGDGAPIAEPEHQTEEPEALRCFPGDSRPDDWLTIPQFARQLAEQLPQRSEQSANAAQRARLDVVLGGTSPAATVSVVHTSALESQVKPEPGVTVRMVTRTLAASRPEGRRSTVIVLKLSGDDSEAQTALMSEVVQSGGTAVSVELRATGQTAWPKDKIGRAVDHNSAEWSLWLGRPLLGQWVMDVRSVVSTLRNDRDAPPSICIIGVGHAGVVALAAAAVDSRIDRVAVVDTLGSYITSTPYEGQRLGLMVPGILKEVGDVADLATMIAPRKLMIAGAVYGNGETLSANQLQSQFKGTRGIYGELHPDSLVLSQAATASEIVAFLLKF